MITVEIDCPFSVGDLVYIKKKEYETAEIECPFCHGNSKYDTGIKIKDIGKYKNIDSEEIIPWIITCDTCGGTGKISKLTDVHYKYYLAKLTGIYKMSNITNWRDCIYTYVNLANEEECNIEGRNILTKEEYRRIADDYD